MIRSRRTSKYAREQARDRKAASAYYRWISEQPCVVCGARPVTVAHVGERAFGRKCHYSQTLPICVEHHLWEGGPESQHRLGKRFWEFHGLDRDALIAEHQARYVLGVKGL